MPIKIRKTLLKEPIIFDTVGNHWEQTPVNRPHGFPLYHYLQTERGKGRIEIRKKQYILDENEGVLIEPFMPHSYKNESDKWITMFATFTGTIKDSIPSILGNRPVIFVPKERGIYIAQLIADMVNKYENPTIDAKAFSIDTYRLLMCFTDDLFTYTLAKEVPFHKYVAPVISEIELHYDNELTVDKLSKLVYISPQYLSRLFNQYFGCSVYKYLTNYRINKAKELLITDSRTSVQDIAQAVGFIDTSHFIVMFKKFTGMTPLDFRKICC